MGPALGIATGACDRWRSRALEGARDLGDLGAARLDSWHLVRDGERHSGGRASRPCWRSFHADGRLRRSLDAWSS